MSHKNVFTLLVMLVVISVLISSCTAFQPESADPSMPKEVQITEADGACGSGVGLNIGDTLVLILDGNPSTGYAWEVGFYVPEVIEPQGEPEYQANSDLVGADGKYTFRFIAVGEGQVGLRMIYRRSFDQEATDFKSCEVNVSVK